MDKGVKMTTIRLEEIDKKIKDKVILEKINLELSSGTCYGFSGINGSGKTMLMRLICGLIKPTGGEILINGVPLGKETDFPESVGFLIENPAFIEYLNGFDNLKLIAKIKQVIGDEDIHKVIEKVGLNPGDKKKFSKYSLGMKQRLGIAAAIMENAEIIILDEPTNALDREGIAMLIEVVEELKAKEKLIILSCHDSDLLNVLADEIYFLENGSIYERIFTQELQRA